MSSGASRFFDSVYVRIAFGAVLAFAGVVIGIYAGFALTGQDNPLGRLFASLTGSGANRPWVDVELGDLFPLEPCLDSDGNASDFEQVLHNQGKGAVLFFVSFECEPCRTLLEFWRTQVSGSMRPDVQVIICLPQSRPEIPPEHQDLVAGHRVVYYNDELFRDKYHFVFVPTLFAVDKFGFVQHITFGFGPAGLDEELHRFATGARQQAG